MVPIRTCIGCRTKRPAAELVRYAIDAEGAVCKGRHLPGRGAWLCRNAGCLRTAVTKGAFSKALRATVRREALEALLDEQSRVS